MKYGKKKLYEFLYYLSITLYLIGRFSEYTIWIEKYGNFFSQIKNCAYLLLSICIIIVFSEIMFSQRKRLRVRMLPLTILEIFFLIYALGFDVKAGFVCINYSICSVNVKQKKMYRYMMILMVFLLFIGIAGGLENIRTVNRLIGNTKIRYSFSFTHPYTMQVLWMSVVSCWVIINQKTRISYVVIMSLIAIILYWLGGTRSAFVSTGFMLFFYYLFEKTRLRYTREIYMKGKIYVLRHIFTMSFLIINGLCLLMTIRDSSWMKKLDYLFTGRLSITVRYFKGVCKEMVPLFPVNKNINLGEWLLESYDLDSEYSQLLFGYGLIYSIVILSLLYKVMKKFIELHLWSMVIVFIAIALNSMMEPTILSILYNPGVLSIIPILFKESGYIWKYKTNVIREW